MKDDKKTIDDVVNSFADQAINISLGPIKNVRNSIIRVKELIDNNEINQAVTLLDRCNMELNNFLSDLKDDKPRNELLSVNEKYSKYKITTRKICGCL